MLQKVTPNMHLTKFNKHDNDKLCLSILEENIRLILTPKHILKLKHRVCVSKYKLHLNLTESFKRDNIEIIYL